MASIPPREHVVVKASIKHLDTLGLEIEVLENLLSICVVGQKEIWAGDRRMR